MNRPTQIDWNLKGKRIGVFSMTSMRTFDGKAMVKAAGLDPDKDVSWVPVGIGAQAATALSRGDVDALTLWDSTYTDIENLGFVAVPSTTGAPSNPANAASSPSVATNVATSPRFTG